jgi:penicillin amidase
MRRIIDLGDVNNSVSILPTGQSGVMQSKHYADQAENYVKGFWRPQLFDEGDIRNGSCKNLIFTPY